MNRLHRFHYLQILSIAGFVTLVLANTAYSQTPVQIEYTVSIASVEDKLFHVSADINNISSPSLDLSLPVWTPGWYTIENYAKNILRLKCTDAMGARLPHRMVRKQTWRVDTRKHRRIKVEFDYRAQVLALNQARIADDFAFFTGIQLFLMVEGHRAVPATVRFDLPEGWRIATALKETDQPMTFQATDYDSLVDAPTLMGRFDLTEFSVKGKPHFLAAVPAGAFSKEHSARFTGILTKIALTQSDIFGDLPYEKYVYFYFFTPPESNASGALEHQNSYVAFAPPGELAEPEYLAPTAAHEFFHVWNVKRIRPAELWPYDYSRESYTPLLWVSEGFTTYYTEKTLYRSEITGRDEFLRSLAEAISAVENNDARNYISPADASTSTWNGYDTPVAFGISYYTQGQVLGALLDLSILNDTGGASGLDDVMQTLYKSSYQKDRGFSTEDLLSIMNRIAGKSYEEFYRRYVWGVDVPPYDAFLGYAGYRLERTSWQAPQFGAQVGITTEGPRITRVLRGTPAARSGLMPDDILLSVDGIEVRRGLRAVLTRLSSRIGENVELAISRAGRNETLRMKVQSASQPVFRIVELAEPNANRLKIRQAWLRR